MGKDNTISTLLQNLLRQISGKVKENEGELYPEYIIKGTGVIYCPAADARKFIKINRNIGVYLVSENYDTQGRSLVYTHYGDLILIDPEEIEKIGFD
tara:strand:+ start:3349 stop:3639 length:291 start_codon:yes stop_codon:yes gene_type:complete